MAEAPELTIRAGGRVDLAAVVRLLADDALGAAREIAGDDVAPAYLDAFDAMQAQGGNLLLVAEMDGMVVGCLQLTIIPGLSRAGALRAQIEGVRVAAAHRGRGVGERLIEAALDRARAAGCQLAQLTSDVSRVDAQRFYERLGFRPTHVGFKRPL
ncbi:MAG: GNAT family N-acetyltransferase [Vicinamibacterales bacterium]